MKVDCPLAELVERKDGDWVTAGGIITAAKKIRTKKGDPMMFATLDDLEGSIEMLVFGKTLAEFEPQVDDVVLVRGKVDHGDKGTSLVAQSVERFEPSQAEVERAREEVAKIPRGPQPILYRIDATRLSAGVIDDLKHVLGNYPGESEVVLHIDTSQGARTLRLGREFRVEPIPSLRAELERILGPAAVQSQPA
jgi:DNA polymerase-3 subunit alpha